MLKLTKLHLHDNTISIPWPSKGSLPNLLLILSWVNRTPWNHQKTYGFLMVSRVNRSLLIHSNSINMRRILSSIKFTYFDVI